MKCIIIEDEMPAQRILKNYISKFPELELVGSFQSVFPANSFLESTPVDLVFLDINLPDINGLQFIRTLNNPPRIIMTTAYHEHAVESFELETICDYLVKPFSIERFLKAINKAKKHHPPQNARTESNEYTEKYVYVKVDKTLHKLEFNDICVVESNKNYVTLINTETKLSYIDTLKSWIEKLPKDRFIQVHKSFIINLDHVVKINGNQIQVNQHKIPIGRIYKKQLMNAVNTKLL